MPTLILVAPGHVLTLRADRSRRVFGWHFPFFFSPWHFPAEIYETAKKVLVCAFQKPDSSSENWRSKEQKERTAACRGQSDPLSWKWEGQEGARAAGTKYPRLGGFNNRNLFSHASPGCKLNVNMSAGLFVSKVSLLGLSMAISPLCLNFPILWDTVCRIRPHPNDLTLSFFLVFCLCLGLNLGHMEVPRLGV